MQLYVVKILKMASLTESCGVLFIVCDTTRGLGESVLWQEFEICSRLLKKKGQEDNKC